MNSSHKGPWRGTLACAWIYSWANNREDGDLRRHRAHYDVNVMYKLLSLQHTFQPFTAYHLINVQREPVTLPNKANRRDLIAAIGLVILNWIQIIDFSARVTLKFDGWPRKIIGHFFYTTPSFVHHLKSIKIWHYFVSCDLENLWMALENHRAPLLYYIKLCASFQIHRWSQAYSPETLNSGQNGCFLVPRDLEIWWTTLVNNRALPP